MSGVFTFIESMFLGVIYILTFAVGSFLTITFLKIIYIKIFKNDKDMLDKKLEDDSAQTYKDNRWLLRMQQRAREIRIKNISTQESINAANHEMLRKQRKWLSRPLAERERIEDESERNRLKKLRIKWLKNGSFDIWEE